jgi:hypothetical protein
MHAGFCHVVSCRAVPCRIMWSDPKSHRTWDSSDTLHKQVFCRLYSVPSRPQIYFYPPLTNFWHFPLSFISCNIFHKQTIHSFLFSTSSSRSNISTQHHVPPTSQEFPIPLRLHTRILCHITSRLQYQFHSTVFFSLTHKNQQHVLSSC